MRPGVVLRSRVGSAGTPSDPSSPDADPSQPQGRLGQAERASGELAFPPCPTTLEVGGCLLTRHRPQ
eukprot:6747862-Prymnesium_polylepis.1